MSDHGPTDGPGRHRHDAGLFATLATLVRMTILVLALIGLVTVIGMVRTAREPYGGPLEA